MGLLASAFIVILAATAAFDHNAPLLLKRWRNVTVLNPLLAMLNPYDGLVSINSLPANKSCVNVSEPEPVVTIDQPGAISVVDAVLITKGTAKFNVAN